MRPTELYERLDGIFLPLFTPFASPGDSVNEEQLRKNVRYFISRGIRILNPAGTTGEFWMLTNMVLYSLVLTRRLIGYSILVGRLMRK